MNGPPLSRRCRSERFRTAPGHTPTFPSDRIVCCRRGEHTEAGMVVEVLHHQFTLLEEEWKAGQ